MKLLLMKGAVISSLSLTALDLTAQGYMYIRNEAMFAAKSLGTAVVLGTAEDLGYNLQPKMTDESIRQMVDRIADEEGLSRALAHALISQESNYRPDAISEVGAIGLAQVMPANAKRCGLSHAGYLKLPETNLRCGYRILKEDIKHAGNDVHKGIQAYFGGAQCTDKPQKCPKTLNYVKDMLRRMAFGKIA